MVGYELMCEPNAEDIFFAIFGEPEMFYPDHAGTSYDWNGIYPPIVSAIRDMDAETPILLQPMGYGSVVWLPYLQSTSDKLTVYTVHQYEPSSYTHQTPPLENSYPGTFDADYDKKLDQVNRSWLDTLLQTVDQVAAANDAPVAANEFGVMRFEPDASQFMDDLMGLLEQRGMNYALWEWASSWEPFAWNNAFNFRHGPDLNNQTDVSTSDLLKVIKKYWGRNTVRPSTMGLQ
ncbi:MAG: cellulase family glycosylhydrolase [Proteobacteria bacterium]|nr:cellulase family glycosylhydrolase [Pseudomonadota bacterium]